MPYVPNMTGPRYLPTRSRGQWLLLAWLLSACWTMPTLAADAVPLQKPQLVLEGVEGALAANVRSQLRLAAEACDAPRWRIRRLFQAADTDIRAALRPFGYYSPAITKRLAPGEPCWGAHFTIDPGRRLRWSRIDVQVRGEAENDSAFVELLSRVKPKAGAPVDHADYEATKAEILFLAAKRGYREGRFTMHQLRVDPPAGTGEAILHYDSGPRYRFGDINFEQDAFSPDFIQRYSQIAPGDFYEVAAVAQLQRDLMDSGLFSVVDIKPRYGADETRQVPVDVRLVPRKRHAYLVGIGMTTDEGPRVRLGYENRRLNRYGHTGEVGLRASGVRRNLDFSYNMPFRNPRTERLTLQAGFQDENVDDTDSQLYKAGVRYVRRKPSGLVQTLFVEYNRERFTAGSDRGNSTLLMPGIAWDWRRGDHIIYPQQGLRIGLEVRGASRALLSDVDFLRTHLRTKIVEPLWGGRLLGRAELGYSVVGRFSDLPVSQRFFAGGDNSVRGYDYRELGPQDAAGQLIGGRHILTGSIEYEQPLKGKWSAAVFADTGDAFDGSRIRLHHAVGAGVRWRSPIGPVRLDLAHPLDEGKNAFRLHISLGPDL